jgi:ribonucleoside-diphosphate reductase alpha chain
MGLKCVAIYRDGSKRSQPLNTKRTTEGGDKVATAAANTATLEARISELEGMVTSLQLESGKPLRRRLSDTRQALTHKFDIAGHEGYLTVGLFDDGTPGELFITMAKEGSTIGGLMDSIATLTSMSFQYGVPLEALVRKFSHQRFEPSGFTKNPEIRNAASITDYVFRWLAFQFIPGYREAHTHTRGQQELPMPDLIEKLKDKVNRPVAELALADNDTDIVVNPTDKAKPAILGSGKNTLLSGIVNQLDAPTCPNCGHTTVRNGACYKCNNCGDSLGCS